MNNQKTTVDKTVFMSIASKTQAAIAGEMAEEILAIIYLHSDHVPLALAVGVLDIVKQKVMKDHE